MPQIRMTAADIRFAIAEMLQARVASRLDRLMGYFALDTTVHIGSSRAGLLGPGTWRGIAALRSIMRLSDENYQPLDFEILDIVVDGQSAAVRWRGDWRRHATGKIYAIDSAHFLRWENGLVAEMHEFFENASAPMPLHATRVALSDVEPLAGFDRDELERRAHGLASFTSHGPDARLIRELCAPDVVCDFVGDRAHIPYAGRYSGVEALVNIVKAVAVDFEQSHYDIRLSLVDGPRIAVLRTVQWRHRGTGRHGIVDLANFVRFENGKIVEIVEFRDNVTIAEMRGDES